MPKTRAKVKVSFLWQNGRKEGFLRITHGREIWKHALSGMNGNDASELQAICDETRSLTSGNDRAEKKVFPMRARLHSVAAHLAFALTMLAPCLALGMRLPPAEVPPVVDGNVRYEVPHGGFGYSANPCGQIGGCVVAYDNTTGALIWAVTVYRISYDPDREQDVQWVFITCLAVENGQLLVTNERGLHFRIDPTTQEVLDDPCGCDTRSSGCAGEADDGDGGSTPSGDAASSSRPAMHAPGACSVAPRDARIQRGQYQALRAVNAELVQLFWDIGEAIHRKQQSLGWGRSVVETLARDLQAEFPGRNGFSAQNLWLMRQFYVHYCDRPRLQPLVREISWTRNLVILARCKDDLEREFYLRATARFGWTRAVLQHQVDNRSYEKYLSNQTSFDQTLSPALRAQAVLAVKDHYTLATNCQAPKRSPNACASGSTRRRRTGSELPRPVIRGRPRVRLGGRRAAGRGWEAAESRLASLGSTGTKRLDKTSLFSCVV